MQRNDKSIKQNFNYASQTHRKIAAQRFVRQIGFGLFLFAYWKYSPFPIFMEAFSLQICGSYQKDASAFSCDDLVDLTTTQSYLIISKSRPLIILFDFRQNKMTEKRQWTQEEDRLLKEVFENSRTTKWTHIALILQEQHAIRNVNGKQCKERYMTYIDVNHPKEQWSFDEEQSLFNLHNLFGNKWAIIGEKLGNRTDNCVKNHFYTKLRKSLRKINKIIGHYSLKEMKEIKPTILYKIVEASQQKFKLSPCFEKQFTLFAYQLKNQLFSFQHEQGIQQEQTEEDVAEVVKKVRYIANRIGEFELNYKRKGKKQRRGSLEQTKTLIESQSRSISEDDQIEHRSLIVSQIVSNVEDMSDQEHNKTNKIIRRRNSQQCEKDSMSFENIRKRTRSQSKFPIDFSIDNVEAVDYEKQEYSMQNINGHNNEESLQFDNTVITIQILEQEQSPLMMLMNQGSPDAELPQDMEEEEDYRFFEESRNSIGMLPEMEPMDVQMDGNLFG